jgi:hypothetical protein
MVVVLVFYKAEGVNTSGNLIAARVEVSVVLIYFKQSLNVNVSS